MGMESLYAIKEPFNHYVFLMVKVRHPAVKEVCYTIIIIEENMEKLQLVLKQQTSTPDSSGTLF